MPSQSEQKIVMSCVLNYVLEDEGGNMISSGPSKATLDAFNISFAPDIGEQIVLSYTDIVDIVEGDYMINLFLPSNYKLSLSHLGYEYENFLFNLYKLRNELLLKYLLMSEHLRASQISASYTYDVEGEEVSKDLCELRLYESALVVLPQRGKPIRVPYCYISDVREEDYTIWISTENEEKLGFSKMGEKRDYLKRSLSDAINELNNNTQSLLSSIIPQLDFLAKRRLVSLLKDGKAVKKVEIEQVTRELWPLLEKKSYDMGLKDSYDFLRGIGQQDNICIGLKRGLKEGDDYLWFLVPIYDSDHTKPGNALAVEATGDNGGRATYFFRIISRSEYAQSMDIRTLHQRFDKVMRNVNRCMIETNFRREPIYLTEEELSAAKYTNYRYAVQEIPSLKLLRDLFIGRVAHYNPEQWKRDVMDLLRFNISQVSESIRWSKGAE